MQKEALAWLIIRTIGLVLLGLALFQLFTFMLNAVFVMSVGSSNVVEGTIRLPNLQWDPLFYGGLLLFIAVYFLRQGATIHRWLLKDGRG